MTPKQRQTELAGLYVALAHSPLKCARIVRRVAAAQGKTILASNAAIATVAQQAWRKRVWEAIRRLLDCK